MNIFDFMNNHPFISLFICWAITAVIARFIVRISRVAMVGSRGWPPAHLDADGDWKPEPKEEEE